jgi:hypothetical protein
MKVLETLPNGETVYADENGGILVSVNGNPAERVQLVFPYTIQHATFRTINGERVKIPFAPSLTIDVTSIEFDAVSQLTLILFYITSDLKHVWVNPDIRPFPYYMTCVNFLQTHNFDAESVVTRTRAFTVWG